MRTDKPWKLLPWWIIKTRVQNSLWLAQWRTKRFLKEIFK